MRTILPITCFSLMLLSVPVSAASPDLNSKLAQSVMYADAPAVKALLAKGADANTIENGRSLLGWAAQSGDLAVVEALLAAKADVNNVDGVGHTPLMRAIEMQQIPITQALLKAKPDLSIRERDGKTVAMMAVASGKAKLVQLLLEAGADFNAATPDGDTPAMVAAEGYGDEVYEIIRVLGQHKVDFNQSNPAYTPLIYALQQENEKLITALLEAGANPNTPSSSGQLPLSVAIYRSQSVIQLLKAGADPNAVDDYGQPVLFAAMDASSPESAKALIEAGADVNVKDRSGTTALEYAESRYIPELVELIKSKSQAGSSAEAVAEEPEIQSSGAPRNELDGLPKLRMVQEMEGTALEVMYYSSASVTEIMSFYRKELKKQGWKELDSNTDDTNYAVMSFQKAKERLSVSLSLMSDSKPSRVMVDMVPLGSMNVASLPRYAGTSTLFEQDSSAIYVTPDKVAKVGAETMKMLQAAGWKGKVTAENQEMRMLTLHKDGHELTAYIAIAPAQDNKTTIQYSLRKE